MKEGAWIHSDTQAHAWVHEHALWIHKRTHAASLGLPEAVIYRLEDIQPDADGPGRHGLLREAMEAGLIRFRGHGAHCTLEGRLPWAAILHGATGFLKRHAGPELWVQIRDLNRQEEVCAAWCVFERSLATGRPDELLPLVQPCLLREPRVTVHVSRHDL